MIHVEQQNIQALCDAADFIDSGFQSFRSQTKLPPKALQQAAFFSGASLVLKLLDHFRSSEYSPEDVEFLTALLAYEVNEYMSRNRMSLEWEPHVPARLQQ